jgi:hypothetical protein
MGPNCNTVPTRTGPLARTALVRSDRARLVVSLSYCETHLTYSTHVTHPTYPTHSTHGTHADAADH